MAQLDALLQKALNDFLDGTQNEALDFIAELSATLGSLERDRNGKLRVTEKNLSTIREVRREILRNGLGASWAARSKALGVAIEESAKLIDLYVTEIVDSYERKAVFDALVKDSVSATVQALSGPQMNSYIADEVRNALMSSLTSQSTFNQTVKALETTIAGNSQVLGLLEREARTIATDAVFTFNREYTASVSDDLGFEWYEYAGSLIDTSREFCVARAGKIWHISEIMSWANLQWAGKNKATNQGNIMVLLGGYNCGHRLLPVSESQVPESVKARIR